MPSCYKFLFFCYVQDQRLHGEELYKLYFRSNPFRHVPLANVCRYVLVNPNKMCLN